MVATEISLIGQIMDAKMRVFFFFFFFSTITLASERVPSDVRQFLKISEDCVHMSGEIAGDNSSADKEAIKLSNRYCGNAEGRYFKLIKKYKRNHKIIRLINETEFAKNLQKQ